MDNHDNNMIIIMIIIIIAFHEANYLKSNMKTKRC